MISGVASQALPASTFTSTYDHYKILIDLTAVTADAIVFLKMRNGVTDASTNYDFALYGLNTVGTLGNAVASGGTSGIQVFVTDLGTSNHSYFTELTVSYPALAQFTCFTEASMQTDTGGLYQTKIGAGIHKTATSYDSANLIASAGAITGVIKVYGFNQ